MQSAREVALKVLYQIEEQDAYANLVLGKAIGQGQLSPLDRGLATELVYGVTRSRNTLDWILEKFVISGLGKLTPWIRNILRLGVYQLFYLEKIPVSAAVHESVNLAKKYGHPGTVKLVNGVLRNVLRKKATLIYPGLDDNPVEHISLKYSHPAWLVKRWLNVYGIEDTVKMCRLNNQPAVNSIRTNTLQVTRQDLTRELEKENVSCQNSSLCPEGLIIAGFKSLEDLPAFQAGHFLLQDEASMLVSHVVHPQTGQFIIDACAAPGTKSTHLAQLIRDQGKIIACDIHPHKLGLIEQNCTRLGLKSIETRLLDARNLGEVFPEQADCVLVDAPCSGLGVLRRRPDARWKKSPEQIEELSKLQLAILNSAGQCLKPGGVLVYSTCSLAPEENTEVISEFLRQNSRFHREQILGHLPFKPDREEDLATAQAGYLQFLPHLHGTDGFFMCRMRRKM